MEKGLLIYRINRDDPANLGVIKKCKAQQEAFRRKGLEVDMLWLCKKGVLLNETLVFKADILPHSLKVYFFYFFRFGKIIKKLVEKKRYNFIYLRHPFFDPLLDQSLRQLKKAFPKIKIILEINTFPYDAEPKRLLHRLSLKMDQHFRKIAHEYIDRIVDYGQRKAIWNIPVINIRNGIDVPSIALSKSKKEVGKLRLIAVGNWSYWHGLDRLIAGFEAYDKTKNATEVVLTIVGEGPQTKALKQLVRDRNLEKSIRFFPASEGQKLDALFDQADLGIGTLGLHRKGVKLDSSLKHREYCARGIPFILSSEDPDFPMHLSFVHYVSKDEQPVDLNKVINWNKAGMKTEVRKYAEENLVWEKQLKSIVAWIKNQDTSLD